MSLDYVLYGNTLRDWLIALALGAGASIALVVLNRLLVSRLSVIAARTTTDIDDALVDIVRRTQWFFFAAIGIIVAAPHVAIPPLVQNIGGRKVLPTIMLLQVGLWLVGLVTFLTERALKRRRDAEDRVGVAAIRALGVTAKIVAWALLLVLSLRWAFGLDVTLLVTSLSVGTLAIGLAMQQILGDLLAAISIVFDQPFDVGDDITVDGVSGVVERVGLKTTRLRSTTGEQIIFSNGNLLKSRIHNFSRLSERRTSFQIDLDANTSPDVAGRVPSVIEEIVRRQPITRFVRCHLTQLTDSGIRYECVFYVQQRELIAAMNTQQAISLEILRRFSVERIEFARPLVAAILKQ